MSVWITPVACDCRRCPEGRSRNTHTSTGSMPPAGYSALDLHTFLSFKWRRTGLFIVCHVSGSVKSHSIAVFAPAFTCAKEQQHLLACNLHGADTRIAMLPYSSARAWRIYEFKQRGAKARAEIRHMNTSPEHPAHGTSWVRHLEADLWTRNRL